MIFFTSENILLIVSILIFSAIIISRAGFKYGVPSLLLFLVVGMLFGVDGLGLHFHNYRLTQFIGIVALSIILFTGGLETKIHKIRPIIKEGITLSTITVLLTTALTGAFIFFIANSTDLIGATPLIICLLMAAVMSSTDSASVFNILKTSKMRLKENIAPMLELESGSNDPIAYCTTILLIQLAQISLAPNTEINLSIYEIISHAISTFLLQFIIAIIISLTVGYLGIWVLKKIQLHSTPLYAILLLSIAIFTISLTEMLNGNGYLAVYLTGIIIGNKPFPHKKEIYKFMDGMTWLMQIAMFLTLGLLVNPREMFGYIPLALIVGIFLIFVARPLSVFISLLPFRKLRLRSKLFISWVGLKGAAPIIFATYPVISGIPEANKVFNIVFIITLLSLLIQGMSIKKLAQWLHLAMAMEKKPETFGIIVPEEAGKLIDHKLSKEELNNGSTLKEIELPEGARVLMIYRDGKHIVPDGSTKLQEGDNLLMIFGDYSEDDE